MVRNIVDSTGGRNSVYPCTEGMTFYPFIYMVPQYKPESVLMLGYAGGTTSGLIHMLYGDVPVTGVDIGYVEDHYDDTLFNANAQEFIKTCEKFDTVIVDLYADGQYVPCKFITEESFIYDLRQIANYIIVHAKESTDMTGYGRPLKVLELNDSRFYYYVVNYIPQLPIR